MNNKKRKTLLLIADDISHQSGVARMCRNIIDGSIEEYNWLILGANNKLPKNTPKQFIDISKEFIIRHTKNKLEKIGDEVIEKYGFVRMLKIEKFGTIKLINLVLDANDIDGIVLFTDPKRFIHVFNEEYNIRKKYPIIYINIWDNLPYPVYNTPFYESCDALYCISEQTNVIVKKLLHNNDNAQRKYITFDELKNMNSMENKNLVTYFPHGIDEDLFFNIRSKKNNLALQKQFEQFKKYILQNQTEKELIFLFNGRNMRRKHVNDIILSYAHLIDYIKKNYSDSKKYIDKLLLIIKSDVINYESGTNLLEVYEDLVEDGNITFISTIISDAEINFLYNVADFTLLPSDAEGFGIPFLESIYTNTPLIANITGGLQDQMIVKDGDGKVIKLSSNYPSSFPISDMNKLNDKKITVSKHVLPIEPIWTLSGSVPTPYIYNNHPSVEKLSKAMLKAFNIKVLKNDKEYSYLDMINATKYAKKYLIEEKKMNKTNMNKSFIMWTNEVLNKWVPRNTIDVLELDEWINSSKLDYRGIYNALNNEWN